jgi:hypothetical protein
MGDKKAAFNYPTFPATGALVASGGKSYQMKHLHIFDYIIVSNFVSLTSEKKRNYIS